MKNNFTRINVKKSIIVYILFLINIIIAQNKNVLQPMDIFEMEGVSDPRISPDGSQIIYVRSGSDVMKDKRYSNIWIIDLMVVIIAQSLVGRIAIVSPAGLQMANR